MQELVALGLMMGLITPVCWKQCLWKSCPPGQDVGAAVYAAAAKKKMDVKLI